MIRFRNMAVAFTLCGALLAAGALASAGAVYAQSSPAADLSSPQDPSSQQIYDTARAGNLALAQQMIGRVLRDHPRSAKAHYVAAQLYARSGDFTRARQELSSAQVLDPGLAFARPTAVAQLERALGGRSGALPGPPHRSASWPQIVLILVGVGLLISLLRRRSMAAQTTQGYAAYPGQPGQSGMYPGPYGQPMGMGAPQGSGLMRNLATGLAVGAGMAAGEDLVQHMIGGSAGGIVPSAGADELANAPDANMGGTDFGLNADNGSWDGGGGGFDGGGDASGGGDWS